MSASIRKFFAHVVKGMEKKDKFFKNISEQESSPLPSDWRLIRNELKKIADGVEANKMHLDILQDSNYEISKELDDIRNFETALASSIGSIKLETPINHDKYRGDSIRKLQTSLTAVDKHVDHIVKVRQSKANKFQKQLDRLENLMKLIIDNYNKVLVETKRRKDRVAHIEKKMHKQLNDDDLKVVELKEKIDDLEKMYQKARAKKLDQDTLTKIRAKINLLRKKLNQI